MKNNCRQRFVCPALFHRNPNAGLGGALFVAQDNGSLSLVDCFFKNNSAFQGGAFYGQIESHILVIQNCSFYNNMATNYGGALFFHSISVTLVKCNFHGNSCPKAGAIGFTGVANKLLLVGCKIVRTNAEVNDTHHTRYMSAVTISTEKLDIQHCIFHDNVGSGLLMVETKGIISNCSFVNNTGNDAGAITSRGYSSVIVVKNTSFFYNSGSHASALFLKNQVTLVQNCLFRSKHVSKTWHVISISSKRSVSLHICGCVFWESQLPFESFVAIWSSIEDNFIHATIYFWNTFIQKDNDLFPVQQISVVNGTTTRTVSVNRVHLNEVSSQYASGELLFGHQLFYSELNMCSNTLLRY